MSDTEPIFIDIITKKIKRSEESKRFSRTKENLKDVRKTATPNKIYISSSSDDDDIPIPFSNNNNSVAETSNFTTLSQKFTKLQNYKIENIRNKRKHQNTCISISSSSGDDDDDLDESSQLPSFEKLMGVIESKEAHSSTSERNVSCITLDDDEISEMDTSLIKPKEKNNFETHIANEDLKNEEKKNKQSDSESDSDMSLPAIECEIQLSSKAEKDTSENENDDMNVICKNLQKGSKTQQKKFEKEQQKLLKEIEKEIRSYSKPDMALKIVSMEIDNEIEGLSNVSELWSVLQESGIKYKVEDNAIKSSILWFRDVIGHKISAEGKVNRTVERVPEEHLLIVFPTSQFIDMVAEMKQPSNVNMNSLISLTTYYETIYPEKKITYVAIGIEKYFRELKNKQNRNFRAQIRGDKYEPIPQKLSFSDIGEAVVCLQIQKNITLHLIDSVNELGLFLVSFSKAIAETPYKRERQNKFSWYAEGDTNKSVKVVDDASLSKLWKQQIEQFALVSKDVSEAIVVKYPTPQTLIQAYKECSTKKEAENLLKNIQVRRGFGPLATSRNVGPELSRKIFRFFTETDENVLL